MKTKPTKWEKISANYSDKVLVTKIYRELKKLNSKNETNKTPWLKICNKLDMQVCTCGTSYSRG
jgi:hypothetical protein